MQKLLFFSRVAFICNLCFAIAFGMQYYPLLTNGFISSTLLVMGVGIAFLLNLAVNLLVLFFLIQGKLSVARLPRWLIIANFLFLIPQLILLVK